MKNYNEQLENKINEIMNQVKGYGYDYSFLIKELEEGYQKTNYPGYLHRIGYLYETKLVKPTYENQHLTYYKDAAEFNYEAAILKLNQCCFEKLEFEIDLNEHMASKLVNLDDPYATYLLAKYYMMKSICINQNDEIYNLHNALNLMKDSASRGCEEAIHFMNSYNQNNKY